MVEPRAVKLHVFRPSGRKLWTVVGRDEEYWADPHLSFCSCKNYFYKSLSNGKPCYHLRSIFRALNRHHDYISFEFDDGEYKQFLNAVIRDSVKNTFRL
jgi:predicted nucleic acid-binding Zn finger protein